MKERVREGGSVERRGHGEPDARKVACCDVHHTGRESDSFYEMREIKLLQAERGVKTSRPFDLSGDGKRSCRNGKEDEEQIKVVIVVMVL